MAYLNPDDAYKPHIRLTETKRDQFGSKSTNSQDSDPEEVCKTHSSRFTDFLHVLASGIYR